MDKFRKIVTDSFYAGVVEIDKQVKFRNEAGLHEPLISLEQHNELVRIMDSKKKTQSGPRKNGNPDYPLSNLITCALCADESTIARYAGYDHGNGKNPKLTYHKYRCRACNRYLTREELHPKVTEHFRKNPITREGVSEFIDALNIVWKQRESQSKKEVARINQKIKSLRNEISTRTLAAIDPSNASIKTEIITSIESTKFEIAELEDSLSELEEKTVNDKEQFLLFAFEFIDNMGSRFLEKSPVNRLRCKQVIFPAGFYLDANNKVYTPEISPLITLQAKKRTPKRP